MNDCVIFVFWPQIIPGVEWFPNVLNHVSAILCVLKPSEQCIWRAVLFSLIFSLTAKARLKLTGSQAVQHSASPAQKRTAKHAKTGLEIRKTGSSPVLSTMIAEHYRWNGKKASHLNGFGNFLFSKFLGNSIDEIAVDKGSNRVWTSAFPFSRGFLQPAPFFRGLRRELLPVK